MTNKRTHATTPGRASQSPAAAAVVAATAEAIVELRSALWKMLRQLQQQAKGSSSSNSNDNNDNSNSNCPEIMLSKTENSKVIAACTHSHTHIYCHTHVQANKQQIISRMKISFDIVFCASVRHSLLHLNDGNQSRRIKEIKKFWLALLP